MGISEAIDIDGTSDSEEDSEVDASGIAEMKGSGGSAKSSKVRQIVIVANFQFQSQIDIFIAYTCLLLSPTCTGNDNGGNGNWIYGDLRFEEFKEQIFEGKSSLFDRRIQGIFLDTTTNKLISFTYIHPLVLPSLDNNNGGNSYWFYNNIDPYI